MSVFEAIKVGDLELAKELLKKVWPKDMLNHALVIASDNGYLDIVKEILNKGADIHASNNIGLRIACSNGNLEIVKELLDRGADIHAFHDKAFYNAVAFERVGVIKLLLSRGANIKQISYHRSCTRVKKYLMHKKYWSKWRRHLIAQWAKKVLLVWYRPDMPGGQRAKKDIAEI